MSFFDPYIAPMPLEAVIMAIPPPPLPAQPGPFIRCPSCHNASTSVLRIGTVGTHGIKDSRRFFCEACSFYFTSMGETFWEAHGRLREV